LIIQRTFTGYDNKISADDPAVEIDQLQGRTAPAPARR
jgi:hypothetical protein